MFSHETIHYLLEELRSGKYVRSPGGEDKFTEAIIYMNDHNPYPTLKEIVEFIKQYSK